MNNPTYLNRYRQSLLAKQRELLTANGGRLVLAPAGGLGGADEMDQALAESQATVEAHVSQTRSRLRQAIEWALVRLKKGNYGLCAGLRESDQQGSPKSRSLDRLLPRLRGTSGVPGSDFVS